MSVKQPLVEEKLLSAPALAEVEQPPLSIPSVEYVGLIAIMHSDQSQRISFASGATGHTNSHAEILGKLPGGGEVVRPLQGNILVVPRAALIDTHREIAPYGLSLSFGGGKHLLQSINEVLRGREIRGPGMDPDAEGVRYDACISLFDDRVKEWQEVIIATSGSPDLLVLHVPPPKVP